MDEITTEAEIIGQYSLALAIIDVLLDKRDGVELHKHNRVQLRGAKLALQSCLQDHQRRLHIARCKAVSDG